MAFDHERQQLNGIYDFADSGLGPLHQEFIYSNLISPDLTVRIVAAYACRTGRMLDRRRINILTGFHRLSELDPLPPCGGRLRSPRDSTADSSLGNQAPEAETI
jgi:hypothetical protein